MKTKRYTLAGLIMLALFMTFSTGGFAQSGRYRHGGGYAYGHSYRNQSVRYYRPVRHYQPVRYYSPVRYYRPARYYSPGIYYNARPYVSIYHGGVDYRYQEGYFYRPYGSSFQFVIPPFGIHISSLPMGYRSFNVGPSPYYYYGGVYYKPYSGNQYEVVKPPLGAVVNELPPGAKATVVNGKKYYQYSGTYYEESINDNNRLEYTVVGTDGVLNTENAAAGNNRNYNSDNDQRSADNNNNNQRSADNNRNNQGTSDNNSNNRRSADNSNDNQRSAVPAVGDRFEDLPADSKSVVINNEKLYISPSGLYYKEIVSGNQVYYEVVGR
jgi:hypothetical protein